MKEYGIMEIFIADQQQMQAEDGKQEIYLEWPYRKLNFFSIHFGIAVVSWSKNLCLHHSSC